MSKKDGLDFQSQDILFNTMRGEDVFKGFYLDEHTQEIRSDVAIAELQYDAGSALEDRHLIAATVYLSRTYRDEVTSAKVFDILQLLAYERRRNPVRLALEELVWDKTARLDDFLIRAAGVEDSAYARAVTAKTLIAAVARVYRPGCKVDTVLILEGAQGAKKTSLLEELGAIAGDRYVLATKVVLGNKDTLQNIYGAWFVIIDEFASFRRAEIDDLKAFLSARKDRFRAPYARLPKEPYRRCIFLATINDTENRYLEDVSGNRRFWPLEVAGVVDLDLVRKERAQIWAEAVARFKAGELWYIDEQDPVLAAQVKLQQDKRQTSDPWEGAIADFISSSSGLFTQDNLLETLGVALKDRTQGDKLRVGKILTKLGLKANRSRTDEGRKLNTYDARDLKDAQRAHLKLISSERGPVAPEREKFTS